MQTRTLYETDFAAWATAQAAAVKEGRWDDLDIPHLVEEIDDLSGSLRRAVESHLRVLLVHLLKLQRTSTWIPPSPDERQWRNTVKEQARRIKRLLLKNPSLQPTLFADLPDAYDDACEQAADELDRPVSEFSPRPDDAFTGALAAVLKGQEFGFRP